jgi:lipoyl(octanoyl) transferase
MEQMNRLHALARKDGQNHLILTQHTPCFTVGRDAWEEAWDFPVIKSTRGGSITCHAPGQNVYYFIFQAPSPPRFFQRVVAAFSNFFDQTKSAIRYEREHPGFYIENRKICSLGFRYQNGISLHGVALNVNPDLTFCSRVNPCNLEGVQPTSLHAESIPLSCKMVDEMIVQAIEGAFDESL